MRLGLTMVVAVGCSGGAGTDDDKDKDTDGPPPVTVTAYEELPVVSHFPWVNQEFEGGRISYYMPPDPAAVLFAFHGSDGSVETVLQIEWLELYNQLEPHGFGFVLAQSIDRDLMQWDTYHVEVDTNLDFQRLARLRDYLVDATVLEADTPVFDAGFSNGGNFAILFANLALEEGWDFRSFLSFNARPSLIPGVPGVYVSAENDEHGGTPENVGPVADACTEAVGEPCPHLRGTEIPLDPRRFARLPHYTLDQSQQIYDELVTLEYVTSTGERIPPLDDVDALMNEYMLVSGAPIPSMPPTQIRVVWATHRVSSQHHPEAVATLVDAL
jgi:hypothetical protein